MTTYELNPVADPRWRALVDRHPRASIFHTPGWLEALQRAYGYEPVAFTTSAPGRELENGIVFCRVESWISGRRLVSLPFSDHCDPLVENAAELRELCAYLRNERPSRRWRYVEIRPRTGCPAESPGWDDSEHYCLHALDLRPGADALFRSFHRSSTQRKIHRAEREGLVCMAGRSKELLQAFYGLVLQTRRRQGLPPQPSAWFDHLVGCLGEAVTVRIASHDGVPIAGILSLRSGRTTTYKYGASDAAQHRRGGMQFLFWAAIQQACAEGSEVLDLGRSELDQAGLLAFKDRWGAQRSTVTYWREPASRRAHGPVRRFLSARVRQAFVHVPDALRAAAGRALYRHVG